MKEMIGRVLRIEKTSIHDGEGLRTVVFLKGCPLRCKWCSTPESQPYAIADGYGMDMTVQEIINEVSKDEIFFFHSGGGVTISGGEVLNQSDYASEILKGCQELGVHTAVETSLYAKFEEIEKLLPYLCDMYIDMKLCDEENHKKYTGVSNAIIKDNLLKLNEVYRGVIHIRIPVIPSVNLYKENMEQTAMFLEQLSKVKDVELLPYHRLGMDTYRKLGKTYELSEIETPNEREVMEMAKILLDRNPHYKVKISGKIIG